MTKVSLRSSIGAVIFFSSSLCWADTYIDRVYHPYVEALETEVEWRTSQLRDDPASGRQSILHRLAFGKSITDKLFIETYLLAEKEQGENFQFEGFELEAKYQLTEQGEYWADWGALVEVERETSKNVWEIATALLMEKELGSTSLAANMRVIYEFGHGIDNEFETQAAIQWRKRGNPLFEPAIEFYFGDGSKGLGPVFAGLAKAGKNKVKYEFGAIFGLDTDTADMTFRFLLEYEF